MTFPALIRHTKGMACLALFGVLVLGGCTAQWGMPERGYGYPGSLAAFAPRPLEPANYTYYPRFEAYYEHATKLFHYPSGKKWECGAALPGSTPQDVLSTSGVPFRFPDAPSTYHWQVKQGFPPTWTPSSNRYQEGYEWGHSGHDLDNR